MIKQNFESGTPAGMQKLTQVTDSNLVEPAKYLQPMPMMCISLEMLVLTQKSLQMGSAT